MIIIIVIIVAVVVLPKNVKSWLCVCREDQAWTWAAVSR